MYNWAKNAGYLTKEHLDAIDKYGLCKYHRPSFLRKHFLKQNSGNQHLITTDSPNLNFSSAGF